MTNSSTDSLDRFVSLEHGPRICYRDMGNKSHPALLLIAGLGESLIFWTQEVFDHLVEQGFRVIAIDNRDSGRSTFTQGPPPSLWRQFTGIAPENSYQLSDMARDALGVLDHLGIYRVHLFGRSMGGMIAQIIAINHPYRVLSMTCLYSTTGARDVGGQAWSTISLLAAKAAQNRAQAIIEHLRITRHIAGTSHPLDELAEASLAFDGWNRCAGDQGAGVAQQILAIKTSGDRTELLKNIAIPTLVVNGDRDLMVDPSGGDALAASISGSTHVIIPGMGHHLPSSLVEYVVQCLSDHVRIYQDKEDNV